MQIIKGACKHLTISMRGGSVPTLYTSCAGRGTIGWDNRDECGPFSKRALVPLHNWSKQSSVVVLGEVGRETAAK